MSMTTNIVMTKEHSPHMIEFVVDQSDVHFTNVLMRKVKTGLLVTSHYILTSDVPQWVGVYERDKWEIQEEA